MAGSNKGQIVNRTGLSDVFGVALNTIDSWVRQGCPVVQRGTGKGQPWKFNTADVSQWLSERAAANAAGSGPADEAELKRRKLAAETSLAELNLAKAKEEVAPVREFERISAMMDAAVRANVMNVPGRAVLQLLGETDEARFKRVLREELVLALETAANTDLEAEIEDDESDQQDDAGN